MTWKEYVEKQAIRINWRVDGEKLFRWFIWRAPGVLDAEKVLSGYEIPEIVLHRAMQEMK